MTSLSLILWMPAAGALVLSLLPQDKTRLIRGIALSISTTVALLSWSLWLHFGSESGVIQFGETHPWNPELGSRYALGVDGFSLPMLSLGTLLSVIAMLGSFNLTDRVKGYHVCLLLLEFGVEGVFMSGIGPCSMSFGRPP